MSKVNLGTATFRGLGESLAGKRVLVTGHTGFKGSWLVIWLTALGARVSGLALNPATNPNNYELSTVRGLLADDLRVDVRKYKDLLAAIELIQPEVIFHLAAQPIVAHAVDKPYETFDTNIMGTVSLLEAVRIRQKTCSIIVVTSDKCYVNRETKRGYVETDPLGGGEPYGSSKASAELVVNAYRETYFTEGVANYSPIHLASARAGNVIGGGDWSPYRIVPDVVKALAEKRPALLRSPESVRPWQHVLEPLHGYIVLAEKLISSAAPEKYTQAWNFGSPPQELMSVRELVEMSIQIWGEGSWEPMSNPYSKHEKGLLLLDSTKAMEELGWTPRWEFEQRVEKTISWYRHYYQSGLQPNTLNSCIADLNDYLERDV